MSDEAVPTPSQFVLDLRLPVDAYIPSTAYAYVIETAEDELTTRCMSKRGYSWPSIARTTQGDTRNRRRYGVVEPTVAQKFGFHSVPSLLGNVHVYNERVERYKALSKRALQAAVDPRTGCEALAYDAVYRGAPAPDLSIANNVGAASLRESQDSPTVRQAFVRWSTCMRSLGYVAAQPSALEDSSRWDTVQASTVERLTAVADVHCKLQTGLVRTWFAADSAIQRGEIAQHESYFAHLKAWMAKVMASARRVIGSPPN